LSRPDTRVQVLPDPDVVALRTAERVLELLAQAQAARGEASVVLTGGSISRKVHAHLARHADTGEVDWSRVTFWWGDERYVLSDDEQRNAGQAWEDLLQHLQLDPTRVHAMPAEDDEYDEVEAAAWAYSEELHDVVTTASPWFDVLMLGIGPDGHCASLFPDHPEVHSDADVLAVRNSPKPPPTRISLGMGPLRRADHVLFIATTEEKADAVSRSVNGDDLSRTPSAGPRGISSTQWYVDEAAGSALG
jgi:6-phosphogluconolactonase